MSDQNKTYSEILEELESLSDAHKRLIKDVIEHHISVSVSLSSTPVTEISSVKYSEITGIPHKRVKNWCIEGVLSCRRLDNHGHAIDNWSENPRLGHWYVDTTKPMGLPDTDS